MKEFCESQATRLHETFDCLRELNHDGVHRSGLVHDECPNCEGYEMHSKTCPTPDRMEDTTKYLKDVVWEEGGPVKLIRYVKRRSITCPKCHGSGKISW